MNSEAELIKFFSGVVSGVKAYGSVPGKRPQVFVTVERTGGVSDRFQDYPQFAVQVWAQSRAKASALAYDLRQAALRLLRRPWCANVVLGGLYDFPDPDSAQARYQFTLELSVMHT